MLWAKLGLCRREDPALGPQKFNRVSKLLSSSMKSGGEVMVIERTFEETIQKANRAIDDQFPDFSKVRRESMIT